MFRRDLGFVDLFQQIVPESLAFPLALFTQFGAIWFAIVVLIAVYRFHDREDALALGGLLIAGTATWRLIKEVYVVPRPDQPMVDPTVYPFIFRELFDILVVDAGPGFPSGHAVTTTILYFGLATHLTLGRSWIRYAAATFLVAFVGFTRITLGIHFLTDVIAGALIGHLLLLAYVLLVRTTDWHRLDIAFIGALVIASFGFVANLVINPINPRDLVILIIAIGFVLSRKTRVFDHLRTSYLT